MTKKILKSILVGIVLASFSACASNDNMSNFESQAHAKHIKMLKKKKKERRMKKKSKAEKTTKFCFKDSSSIHYRSSQKCKK